MSPHQTLQSLGQGPCKFCVLFICVSLTSSLPGGGPQSVVVEWTSFTSHGGLALPAGRLRCKGLEGSDQPRRVTVRSQKTLSPHKAQLKETLSFAICGPCCYGNRMPRMWHIHVRGMCLPSMTLSGIPTSGSTRGHYRSP